MYEIGRIYVWVGQVGRGAYLNGTECTVLGPPQRYWNEDRRMYMVGQLTDSPPPPGTDWTCIAERGDLRPRNTPPGERSVMELFRVATPEVAGV